MTIRHGRPASTLWTYEKARPDLEQFGRSRFTLAVAGWGALTEQPTLDIMQLAKRLLGQ